MSTSENISSSTPEIRLIADYDNVVGRAWQERAKGNLKAAEAILTAAGISPVPTGDNR